MAPELLALMDKPHLLLLVLGIGAFSGMMVERLVSALQKRKWRNRAGWTRSRTSGRPGIAKLDANPSPKIPERETDPAEQLRVVMDASFTTQPLLNRGEARLFRELDRAVIGRNPNWQVMAQVSLGEVLRSPNPRAYGCINSKRVDLLLMDDRCQPRHAIEYQGDGHHQGSAAARDAVKKEALRRAGVGYHEVIAGQTTPAEVRRLVEKLVEPAGEAT